MRSVVWFSCNRCALVTIGALTMVGVMAGQQRPGSQQPRVVLQALDIDHDGKLSAAEIAAAPQSLLTLDRNEDGQLTSDELQPRPENAGANPDELAKQLMSFDKNGDGVLTPDEMPARMQKIFQRGDSNHDGRLTADEVRAMATHQAMPAGSAPGRGAAMMRMDPLLAAIDADHNGVLSAEEIAGSPQSLRTLDKDGDQSIELEEMRMHQASPAERADHMLDEWDTNKDGKISKAEAPDRMQAQFGTADKNGDGFLDRSELLDYFASLNATVAQNGAERHGADPASTPGAASAPKERPQ